MNRNNRGHGDRTDNLGFRLPTTRPCRSVSFNDCARVPVSRLAVIYDKRSVSMHEGVVLQGIEPGYVHTAEHPW